MTAPAVLLLPFPQLSARRHGDVTVVSLRGELDCLAVPALLACLRATGERPRSVADLTGLDFIDCACLGVLVGHCAEVRARAGSFALAGAQGAVRRVLAVTRLMAWFEVHETVGQAMAAGRRELAAPAACRSRILASGSASGLRPVQPAARAVQRDVTGVTTAPALSLGGVTTASRAPWPAPAGRTGIGHIRGAAPSAPAPGNMPSL